MKISIVTVCYNSEGTIRDTIESVLSQDYPNIEYIVVDGASNDETISIIDEYKHKISSIISEPDNGIYDAMNKGIRLAQGDFVGILNSDDMFPETNTISDMVAFLKQNVGFDGIYGDLIYVRRDDVNLITRSYSSKFFRPWHIRFGLILPHPTLYIRPKIFKELGWYKLNYRVAADFEMITRLITNGIELGRNPRVMVKMREGGISSTGFWWRVHQNMEIVRACRENGIRTNIFMVMVKIPFKLACYFMR